MDDEVQGAVPQTFNIRIFGGKTWTKEEDCAYGIPLLRSGHASTSRHCAMEFEKSGSKCRVAGLQVCFDVHLRRRNLLTSLLVPISVQLYHL